ncbi:MAG: DnaJ domain-containing protein [Eubacteriaceae bacterium]|nr:DnaJ domain-containing protein [Eubacteriaceae bacterium]
MDYYKTLGVKRNASQDEIRTAYKTLAKKFHPDIYKGDKAFAERIMQEVNVAYDTLSDAQKREMYDLSYSASAARTRQDRAAATSVRKMEEKPPKEKRLYVAIGEVETWNTAPGKGAFVFSTIIWILYCITSSYTMEIILIASYSVLLVLSVIIFVGIRFDVRIDVFFVSIVYALLYSLIYNIVSVSFLYEPFSIFENLLIIPLLACSISLMPASLTLAIVRSLRKRRRISD